MRALIRLPSATVTALRLYNLSCVIYTGWVRPWILMVESSVRSGWVRGLRLLGGSLLLSSCATIPGIRSVSSAPASATAVVSGADEDDSSELTAQLRADLTRYNSKLAERQPRVATAAPLKPSSKTERDRDFADRARALFAPLNGNAIRIPVVGVSQRDLDDSWHAPRDGGAREHKGIDIFAPRGTEVVAVADGVISFIGDQRLGGHCVWLTTENGASFYYAHLDRWAPGLYEGMEVQSGDLLGFVGNTGNAAHTPSHLHFGINQNDQMVNPYPILAKATPSQHAHAHVEVGGGFGTR
jgi:murein DD-endopeptidase MepM/ murein hydrolase activator NlpD